MDIIERVRNEAELHKKSIAIHESHTAVENVHACLLAVNTIMMGMMTMPTKKSAKAKLKMK